MPPENILFPSFLRPSNRLNCTLPSMRLKLAVANLSHLPLPGCQKYCHAKQVIAVQAVVDTAITTNFQYIAQLHSVPASVLFQVKLTLCYNGQIQAYQT